MGGVLTRAELRSEVESNLGNRVNIPTRIDRNLDFAQERIARRDSWTQRDLRYGSTSG